MSYLPVVSVIIPTYNRKDSLLRTLDSLRQQTLSMDRFEAIVVDDGSTDDSHTVASQQFPFNFRYVCQKNQRAPAARNYGTTFSQADVLVFIDDDVTVSPQTLEALAETCFQRSKVLVMGRLIGRSSTGPSVYTSIMSASTVYSQSSRGLIELPYIDCNTELLSCKRSDFLDLGMLQDPTDGYGWPYWDDVEFGYRAHLNGFRLLQDGRAVGEHWDYSLSDRDTACQRWYRVCKSAVWLLRKHKELQTVIPMLADKTPLAWRQDSPLLMGRKLARRLTSSGPVLGSMDIFVDILERHYPSPVVLRRLYYLLQGAYMLRGYRDGMREFELAGAQE